jgi:hypothetical protein
MDGPEALVQVACATQSSKIVPSAAMRASIGLVGRA